MRSRQKGSSKEVVILATMPKRGFSGGRYHALMMALAFALRGHKVTFLTNNIPEMWKQVIGHNEEKARNVIFRRFSEFREIGLRDAKFDLVVCVPGSSFSQVYQLAIRLSIRSQASLAFINFESANWFNHLSPVKRGSWRWWPWKLTAAISDSIVSSCLESTRFAKPFYSQSTNASFESISPAVNDHVKHVGEVQEDDVFRVFVPTRIRGGSHKGVRDFSLILSKLTKPCTVALNVDDPQDEIILQLSRDLAKRGIEVHVMSSISESQKFEEYARASVTLFPSYFEGFGYPPLESIMCGTPCIAYELPVIAEVTRGQARFIKRGDPIEMAEALSSMQRERPDRIGPRIRSELFEYYSLDAYSERLESLFNSNRQKTGFFFQIKAMAIIFSLNSFGVIEKIIVNLLSRIREFRGDRHLRVGPLLRNR